MTVTHKTYGIGTVQKIDKKHNKVVVDFGDYDIREIALFLFDIGTAVSNDVTLDKALNAMRRKIAKENPRVLTRFGVSYGRDSFFTGGMAEDISCSTAELFEAIGYIVKNAHYIEAEVSQDRVELFEEMFHTNVCYIHNDAENNRNQFRIDFDRTDNIPKCLEENLLDVANGRIARSLFVERLVREYGFTFGATQNYAKIREIAIRHGYLAEFEHGYHL